MQKPPPLPPSPILGLNSKVERNFPIQTQATPSNRHKTISCSTMLLCIYLICSVVLESFVVGYMSSNRFRSFVNGFTCLLLLLHRAKNRCKRTPEEMVGVSLKVFLWAFVPFACRKCYNSFRSQKFQEKCVAVIAVATAATQSFAPIKFRSTELHCKSSPKSLRFTRTYSVPLNAPMVGWYEYSIDSNAKFCDVLITQSL